MKNYVSLAIIPLLLGTICYLRCNPSREAQVSYVIPTQFVNIKILEVWPPLKRPIWVYVKIDPIITQFKGEGWLEIK
jgi:hypothetical protein